MKTTSHLLAVAGLFALAFCAVLLVRAKLYQADATRRFVRDQQTTAAPANAVRQPPRGSAIALLTIARLHLSTVVVEGVEEPDLTIAPGHIPGTSMPGGGGNVALAGHRDTFFRPLRLIRKNDMIAVRTYEQEFQYRVAFTEIVKPADVRVLNPAGHETLTLVTCYPFYFVGSAPYRFIVHADCVNCKT